MSILTALLLGLAAQDGDLATRLKSAYTEAADGLVRLQMPSGAWPVVMPDRRVPSVAYTAIAVTALARAPEPLRPRYATNVAKGIEFILSKANLDGSFGEGESGTYMKTYATAVALSCNTVAKRSSLLRKCL